MYRVYWTIDLYYLYQGQEYYAGSVADLNGGFNNTLARPEITCAAGKPEKRFDSPAEAEKWAKAYLPGYRWKIQRREEASAFPIPCEKDDLL